MTSTDAPTIALRYDPLPAELAADAARTFVDDDGGRPLRCCLRDSRPGERLALVAVTPEGPQGAYRETGPVFLHADGCGGPSGTGYDRATAFAHVDRIHDTLMTIFNRADADGVPTNVAADRIAEERFKLLRVA